MFTNIFKKITDSKSTSIVSMDDVLGVIRTGTLRHPSDIFDAVEDVRKATTKPAYDLAKKHLPYFTPCGVFTTRKESGLSQFSGIVHLDIDGKHNGHLQAQVGEDDLAACVRDQLAQDPHTFAAFISAGAKGVAVFFVTDCAPEDYKGVHLAACEYLLKKYDIVADKAVNSISEARFFSVDFNIYHNPNATKFNEIAVPQATPRPAAAKRVASINSGNDFERALELIESGNVDLTEGSYEVWLNLGFAIASKFEEAGREYFHAISQYNEKYNRDDCDKQYSACLKSDARRDGGITIAYFFKKCKEHGITIRAISRKDVAIAAAPQHNDTTESGTLSRFIQDQGVYFDTISRQFFWGSKAMADTDKNDLYLVAVNSIYHGNRKGLPRQFFDTVLNSSGVPQVNSLQEFLEALPEASGTATIDKFISGIPVHHQDSDIAVDFIKRWLVSIIANMYALQRFDAGMEFEVSPLMLMLCEPKGGTGKSEFFARLLPSELRRFFYKTQFDDPNVKDEYTKMSQNLICLLDEVDKILLNDKKTGFVKFVTANDVFDIRAPYKSTVEKRPKLSVFGATSNVTDILLDNEGNRRIIPVLITKAINWELQNSIDRMQLFAELHNLYLNGYQWRIIGEDIARLEKLGANFVAPDACVEMLLENYDYCPGDVTVSPKSLTAIIAGLPYRIQIDNSQLGRFSAAMVKLKWHKEKGGYRLNRK